MLKRGIAMLIAVCMVILLTACNREADPDHPSEQLASGELIVEENDNAMYLAILNYDTLNPLATESNTVGECTHLIYEPLFDFDEAANPIPVLAQDYTVSPDGLQLVITLSEGVVWQDGTPFTAEDVVFTVNSIQNLDCAYSADLRNIENVWANGEHQVIFDLAKPLLNPEMLLSFPVLKNGTELTDGADFVPVGTGAYQLDTENSATNALVLTANGAWHGGKPAISTVVLDVVKDKTAAVYAFEANEIQVLTANTLDLRQSTPRGEFYVYNYTANAMLFLGMNNGEAKFADPAVRQAIGFMLDKQEMIDNEMYTHAVEVDTPIHPAAWFAPKLDKSRREQADLNQLMASAGWTKGEDGFYAQPVEGMDVSRRLKTTILVNQDNEEKLRLAKRIATQLTMAGVETQVEEIAFSQYNKRIDAGEYELFVGEVMLGKNMDPAFLTGADNYFFYDNPELNATLKPAALTKDTDIRRQCILAYGDMFLEEAPFVPLFFRTESVVYDKRISGNKMPTLFRPYRDMDTWYFSKKDTKSE